MSFKIVDGFSGAQGDRPYFGLCDDDRDTRRFKTAEEAEEALEHDRIDAESISVPTTRPGSWRAPKPRKDRWGRRFMNLRVVPTHYRWCINSQDDRWRWQQALPFDFGPPRERANDRTEHWVSCSNKPLGSVEGADHQRWTAKCPGKELAGDFVSAYQAAHALCLFRSAAGDETTPRPSL